MSERVYMMAVSTERLLSGLVSGHNIWCTESLIAGKVAGARGDSRGGWSLAPESERPPVTTVRAQLVGVHCLQRLGPGTEPSTAGSCHGLPPAVIRPYQ